MAGVVLQSRSSPGGATLVRGIAFAAGLLLLAANPAVAQAAKVPANDESVLTTFYKDPRLSAWWAFLRDLGQAEIGAHTHHSSASSRWFSGLVQIG